MNNDQFVDGVYDELENLFNKDQNLNKNTLGTDPILKIFDIYSDWLANNLALSPKVAANTIYKDTQAVNYLDFDNRKIKRGVQIKGEPNFNMIYGSQKEIDIVRKTLDKLKIDNPEKHDLIVKLLGLIKGYADKVKPDKNLYGGKITNLAKMDVSPEQHMPRYGTFNVLLKMNTKQLTDYIGKMKK